MPNKGTIPRVCGSCHAPFEARERAVRSGFGLYCNRTCSARAQRTRLDRTCEQCGSSFTAVPAEVNKGKGKLCSKLCANAALVVPLMDRIWQHIDKREPDDCWLWTAKRHARGYGETGDRGRYLRVTRVLLEDKIGRVLEPGELALHSCSNPPCCNPSHLFAGDHDRNMEQRGAEGKYPNGQQHVMAKLTDDAVRQIRNCRPYHGYKADLARRFGVTHRTIRSVLDGSTWQHVS